MSNQPIRVRRATLDDRERILEISAQIWDGEDYVPELLDGWLTDLKGELVVAMLDDHILAFAHRTWLCPGIAWFEGIRTDPACQGRGAGKAITEYFIRAARDAGATHIELSTYIDNEASIHIIESYGFQLVGTFSFLERPAGLEPPKGVVNSLNIRPVSEQETIDFVSHSEFLSLAQRRFPRGWRFFPFDHDPREAIARLECRLGYWDEDQLEAVLCIRQDPAHGGPSTINFLDGEPSAMRALLNHGLRLYGSKTMGIMVPIHLGRHAAVLEWLREAGFTSWSEFKPDVFAYEMVL
ncbi:GNAT family N-acetyltransferase [Candidatus Bipolaricaulota bacterium]|nr:GNAT family N-acetyltransferase [Candidatus Bipolaricaulota bacterium]